MSSTQVGGASKQNKTGSIVPEDHVYEIPAKLIKTPADMKIWEKSEAYFEYLGFILAINDAIKGKSNSQGSENPSEPVLKLVGLIERFDALIDETPPIQQPQRFGNMAFRTWYLKMREDALVLLREILEKQFQAVTEVICYLIDSFGNSTRIDYGTGHEISFIMFLCSLFKIGLLQENDKVATGCYIFPRYLDLVRKLQKTYRMEPAGSHGVWSLDDYQFVPFIWGSSQLYSNPIIEPSGFLNNTILNDYGEDYMFLTCIQYINSVKTGPFAEHSNQLWSISGVSSWFKINGGLIKMYKAEVLSKFPVVQHIVFGSLFTLKLMEQCPGLMTRKVSMIPPPAPSATASVISGRSFDSHRSPLNKSPSIQSPTSEASSKLSTEKSLQSGKSSKKSEDAYGGSEKEDTSSECSSADSFRIPRSGRGSFEEPYEGQRKSSATSEEKESVRFTSVEDEPHMGRRRFQAPMHDRND